MNYNSQHTLYVYAGICHIVVIFVPCYCILQQNSQEPAGTSCLAAPTSSLSTRAMVLDIYNMKKNIYI